MEWQGKEEKQWQASADHTEQSHVFKKDISVETKRESWVHTHSLSYLVQISPKPEAEVPALCQPAQIPSAWPTHVNFTSNVAVYNFNICHKRCPPAIMWPTRSKGFIRPWSSDLIKPGGSRPSHLLEARRVGGGLGPTRGSRHPACLRSSCQRETSPTADASPYRHSSVGFRQLAAGMAALEWWQCWWARGGRAAMAASAPPLPPLPLGEALPPPPRAREAPPAAVPQPWPAGPSGSRSPAGRQSGPSRKRQAAPRGRDLRLRGSNLSRRAALGSRWLQRCGGRLTHDRVLGLVREFLR